MPRRIALFFLILSCSAFGAKEELPAELEEIFDDNCAAIVRSHIVPETYNMLAFMRTLLPRYHEKFQIFRDNTDRFIEVLVDYAQRESLKRRLPYAIACDMTLVLDEYMTEAFTPELLGNRFLEIEQEMAQFKRKAQGAKREISVSDLALKPKTRELQNLVRNFRDTGLKLHLIESLELFRANTYQMTVDFFENFPDSWLSLLGHFEQNLSDHSFNAMEMQSVYWPRSMSSPDGVVYDSGLYFVEQFNIPGLPEFIIHGMAHAIHDRKWDLNLLLDYFLGTVKPELVAHPQRPLELLKEKFEAAFPATRGKFMASAEVAHRQQVFERGNRLGMTEVDWRIFIDLYALVSEVDAHLKAGLMADERNRPVTYLNPHKVFDHIGEVYVGRGKAIDELSALFFTPAELSDLVRRLNAAPR